VLKDYKQSIALTARKKAKGKPRRRRRHGGNQCILYIFGIRGLGSSPDWQLDLVCLKFMGKTETKLFEEYHPCVGGVFVGNVIYSGYHEGLNREVWRWRLAYKRRKTYCQPTLMMKY
jgi:hypothetical protein